MMTEPDQVGEQGTEPEPKPGKNIVICLDGTGNQYGENLSNVVRLFRMLEREPGTQVAYYDPGVGTMGDPTFKTAIARKVNKVLGLAFGRGLMKNLTEAYTYLMDCYEDGDRVYIFGFSRGAYTARVLAAFIKDCGLFEKGAENLLPYAIGLFLKKPPKDEKKKRKFFQVISGFRSTYGRRLNRLGDPKYPTEPSKTAKYQLRVHFLGLFDTVKSYGWVKNPPVLRNETKNASVLHVRHALAIDERRIFFRQMHWRASNPKYQTCKEVWFPGVHSDVGGGYPEPESGLAKVALEWMVHEACDLGMRVDPDRYGLALQRRQNEQGEWEDRPVDEEDEGKYPSPDASAEAHESLKGAWKIVQRLPKKLAPWEENKHRRTIKSEDGRLHTGKEDLNPLRVHRSVLDRVNAGIDYRPENLVVSVPLGDLTGLPEEMVEQTIPVGDLFPPGG